MWDTLTDGFGPALTRKAEVERGAIVQSLTEALVMEQFTEPGQLRAEINRRASSWPNHYENATLTAHALEKHWTALGRKPLRRR